MVKKISIVQYRKLKNISFDFVPGINFISGENGTCKSSILHIISNAYQAVTKRKNLLLDNMFCINIIKGINANVNNKIESLTKGDRTYNDPAVGCQGNLYTIDYFDESSLSFRKHNSTNNRANKSNRYAIKPWYKPNANESLPALPVIYLGLTRLYPFGEYQNDKLITNIQDSLPEEYNKELIELYKELTGITINTGGLQAQNIKEVKKRMDFTTIKKSIDSNTISSGEENVFIILTALISLKYYYQNISKKEINIASVLLIDEFDATLHPSLQSKLLEKIREYSKDYKIQFVSTTHSITLLEYCLEKKDNIIYLYDDIEEVKLMAEPNINKIKMYLKNIAVPDIFPNGPQKIPVFTEDREARLFFDRFMYYLKRDNQQFENTQNYFHLVDVSMSADQLKNIFCDLYLHSIINAICIIDGDKKSNKKFINNNYNFIFLPGNDSPEVVFFNYTRSLIESDVLFSQRTFEAQGFRKKYIKEHIVDEYDKALKKNEEYQKKQQKHEGFLRESLKKIWNSNIDLITLIIDCWLQDENNKNEIEELKEKLKVVLSKTIEYYNIDKSFLNFK